MATTAEAVASAFAAEDDNSTSFLEWSADNTFDSPIREDADEEEELRFPEHHDIGHVHERADSSSSGDGVNEDSGPEQDWVIVEVGKSAPLPSVGQSQNLRLASAAVAGGLLWYLGPVAVVAGGCLSGLLLLKEREFHQAMLAAWSSTGSSGQGFAGGSTMQVAVTEDQRQMYLTFWRFDTKVDLFKAELMKWALQAIRQGGDSVRKYMRGDLDAAMQQLGEARQREMETLRAQEDRDQLLRQLIQASGLVESQEDTRQLDDSGVSVPVSKEEVMEQVEKVVQMGQAALAELEGLRRALLGKEENLEDMKNMALELQNEMHRKDMEHHHEQEEQQQQMQRTQEAFMKVKKEKEEVEAHMTYMWEKATEQLKAKDKGIEEQKEVLEKQREEEVQRVLQEKEAAKQAFEELQRELQALQQEKAEGEAKAMENLHMELQAVQQEKAEGEAKALENLQTELQALQQEKAAAEAKASEAEEKADKLEEGRRCVVCWDKDRSVVFRPCGHIACCATCGQVEACPMCRAPIEEAVSFYHS